MKDLKTCKNCGRRKRITEYNSYYSSLKKRHFRESSCKECKRKNYGLRTLPWELKNLTLDKVRAGFFKELKKFQGFGQERSHTVKFEVYCEHVKYLLDLSDRLAELIREDDEKNTIRGETKKEKSTI